MWRLCDRVVVFLIMMMIDLFSFQFIAIRFVSVMQLTCENVSKRSHEKHGHGSGLVFIVSTTVRDSQTSGHKECICNAVLSEWEGRDALRRLSFRCQIKQKFKGVKINYTSLQQGVYDQLHTS